MGTFEALIKAGCVEVPHFKQEIVKFLTDHHNVGRLYYSLGLLSVTPALFGKVAHEIDREKIKVLFDPKASSGPHTAEYLTQDNLLYFTFKDFGFFYDQGALIHECTHAIHDLRKLQNVITSDDEVVAWTTQAMFYRVKGKNDSTFPGVNPQDVAVLKAAFSAADEALVPTTLANRASKIFELQRRLSVLPEYKNTWQEQKKFDGIK